MDGVPGPRDRPVRAVQPAWPAGDPREACLVLDFDGTLAPIVADPATSTMPPTTRALLVRLVVALGCVAIVSGRPAAFLAERIDVPGVVLVGLYGLEQVEGGAVIPDPRIAPHLPDLDRARAVLAEVVSRWVGAELEDKGRALAVHWRRALGPTVAGAALTAAVRAAAGGLEVEQGKMVIELRPPLPTDKGTAVARLAAGFAEVAYAGDDLGDLPAFAEVTRRGGLAVAVDYGAETDDRVRSAADVLVRGPEGMAAWLAAVAARVG